MFFKRAPAVRCTVVYCTVWYNTCVFFTTVACCLQSNRAIPALVRYDLMTLTSTPAGHLPLFQPSNAITGGCQCTVIHPRYRVHARARKLDTTLSVLYFKLFDGFFRSLSVERSCWALLVRATLTLNV